MAIHLTNDDGINSFGESENHLGGVNYRARRHLVVVQQMGNWTNKEFVVTPRTSYMKYFQSWSMGKEAYPSNQGGPAVFNDTNTLINNVRGQFNSNNAWYDGQCAVFNSFCRTQGPYSIWRSQQSSDVHPAELSEYGASAVALGFELHHLHFSRMTSYDVYLRVWGGSIGCSTPQIYADDITLINGGFCHSASQLKVKFYGSLPDLSPTMAEGADSFEFGNAVNNGTRVSRDTLYQSHGISFNPFGDKVAYTTNGNQCRIYSANEVDQTAYNYYKDFQITNQGNLDFLKKNPSRFWVVAHFAMGNAFSEGGNNHNGLNVLTSGTVFCERLELVLKCTSGKFNDQ